MSKADRIRSMSDEKLTVFFAENAGWEWCVARPETDDCAQCPNAWLNWLKQEAAE